MFPKRAMLLLYFALISITVCGGVKGASERPIDGASQRALGESSDGVTEGASHQMVDVRDFRIKRGQQQASRGSSGEKSRSYHVSTM